jgi:POT family proton-dependent oligopeptide transporter
MSTAVTSSEQPTLFGHPTALYMLFFAEMWERFSFYGMRALLVLYMTKGFLQRGDADAFAIYGAYGALVYATPLIGGMLADRFLGARRAVVAGGVLMAAGHLLMSIEQETAFFLALGLLIVGNGFFKPNISTIVGSLYDGTELSRDGGFTIFYMGINLGAAAASLLCGYLGETYGWEYGFGLATLGMLVGIAVFVAPPAISRWGVLVGAFAVAAGLVVTSTSAIKLVVNGFTGLAMAAAGVVAFLAMARGGLPDAAGRPPDPAKLREPILGVPAEYALYGAAVLSVPVFALLVSRNEIAGWVLTLGGGGALLMLLVDALRSKAEERDRLLVVFVLMFFSMLFWAFFEQAGSSITTFTERNVDRMIGGADVPAAEFQAANPIFIILFAPVFSWLWSQLGRLGFEPSTPTKFALGLFQLGLGFGAMWLGATYADERGLVAVSWLLIGYLLHTTGEICLSPVGLGMVTRLAPARIVSTVMGAWFLATAFSHHLGGIIATFTAIDPHQTGDGGSVMPSPTETVAVYGEVFGQIGLVAIGASVICLALVPMLKYGMHGEK